MLWLQVYIGTCVHTKSRGYILYAGVPGSCEHGCWELNSGLQKEDKVLLTTEPSLSSPQVSCFTCPSDAFFEFLTKCPLSSPWTAVWRKKRQPRDSQISPEAWRSSVGSTLMASLLCLHAAASLPGKPPVRNGSLPLTRFNIVKPFLIIRWPYPWLTCDSVLEELCLVTALSLKIPLWHFWNRLC